MAIVVEDLRWIEPIKHCLILEFLTFWQQSQAISHSMNRVLTWTRENLEYTGIF